MNKMTKILLRSFIKDYTDVKKRDVRTKYGLLEAWMSIIGNLSLFVIKFILGLIINSIALIADAFHTLSDVLTSGVVLLGFKISQKPPDKEHPFGHGRIEMIATLIIAIFLILVGWDFLKVSVSRIIHPEPVRGNLIIAFLILGTAIIKELMSRIAFDLGKAIKSSILHADAWHHRSDFLTSVLVAIGIVMVRFGFVTIDAILGIGISLFIIYIGINLSKEAVNTLMGRPAEAGVIDKIKRIASTFKGVKGVHDIKLHEYGVNSHVSLHIEVDKTLSLGESHRIADMIEKRLSRNMKLSAVVHVDPV